MEEAEQSLESKEDRLKNGIDPPYGAVGEVSTEIRNGDGNIMEEVKNNVDDDNSSEDLKAMVEAEHSGDIKDGEDEKNLKEVKVKEERDSVQHIMNGDEDKNTGETEVVVEKEATEAVDGDEKEVGDFQDMEGKHNLDKAKDEEWKKEVGVQNGNEMKFVVEEKDGEVNRVLERVADARDKSMEDMKYNNEKYGLGDVEATIGGKSKEEGSNAIDDISVKMLKNGKDGVEEMKDDEHGKPISGEKDENNALVQVEENDRGKARKEVKDMEMVGTEDVVEKEAPDVKDEVVLVVREGKEEEKDSGGKTDKIAGDKEKGESLKRKRGKDHGPFETSEAKKNGDTKENIEELEVHGSRKRSKEALSTPVVSPSDRPVRERKTVERLVEVIEKGPDRAVIIEKGRGTPLREIPNVAYNLGRKKPAELKFLHQTLFGRKGKMADFKSNLSQFSGFAWHESEEKQRAKIKEKLDKCVKETLLELCDLFDLTVSKTNTKKDEIIVKLLDFLESPQAMSNAMNAEKQSFKSQKRERAHEVDASKSSGGHFEKRPKKGHDKTEGTTSSDVKISHDTKDDDEEQSQHSHSESDAEDKKLEEIGDEEQEDEREVDTGLRKGKKSKKSPKLIGKQGVKNPPKKQVSSDATAKRKIERNSKKSSPIIVGKSSLKTPSKHPKAEKSDDAGEKALSKKKNDSGSPKKSNSKSISKEKSSGKASKGKPKSAKSGPTKAELMKSICEILKEVDFNTATFTDILKQLSSEYKTDLTPRKAAIKLMIQEELTKLADQAEAEEEEEEDEEES